MADYHVEPVQGKIRRSEKPLALKLVPNPDVIAELACAAKPGAKVIGFAAEPGAGNETAKEKIARKRLHAIAVNDIEKPGIGFDSGENELTLLFADGRSESSGQMSKLQCAMWLLERALGR